MKQRIKTAIVSIVMIVFLITLNSCAPALQIGAGMAGKGIADIIKPKQSKSSFNKRFCPVPEIDTAKTIIRNIGTPHEIININETGTKQVIVYKRKNWAFLFAVMYNPAKNSMVFKKFISATYKSYSENKRDGTLKNELVNAFVCFHETATQPATPLLASYTPAIGDSFAKVVENLGPPDDSFLLKDENGEPVPGTTLAWWFTVKGNRITKILMMHIKYGTVRKLEKRTGRQTIAFYKTYLVVCATMAARPPRFAFALNSPPYN